jgi:ketosteroid isomerase-like protein
VKTKCKWTFSGIEHLITESLGRLFFSRYFEISKNKGKTMKNTHVWCLLGLLSLASAAVSQAQQTGGSTEKAIMALEDQWLKAQQTNNPDLVAPLLADKFVSTGDDGKVTNKTQALADAKASKYVSAENQNVQVTVFGDTAIATGLWVGKGTDEKGKPFDLRDRWTDTWVKMPNGKWQCAATQSTTTKM